MNNLQLNQETAEIEILSKNLFSTLDQFSFFNELGMFLSKELQSDKFQTILIGDDKSGSLLGNSIEDGIQKINISKELALTHVIKTKCPYFSNNLDRDPLFSQSKKSGIQSEIIIPVLVDGILIATIHLQKKTGEFSPKDIQKALEILTALKKPLSNMKMYLMATFLNEELLKRIEEKEKELASKDMAPSIQGKFKIEERPFLANSPVMKDILNYIDKIAKTEVQLLITGPNGTGKEELARRVHLKSERKDNAFISIDCSVLKAQNFEGAFFGEEKNGQKLVIGALELAEKGTIVLKNIDALSYEHQGKLSQFLKERRAFSVGSQIPYKSNARIISSSKKDLSLLVEEGKLIEELYYLISTASVKVPALKERPLDIEILANYFINNNRPVENQKSLSPCLIRTLLDFHWPGNIRELKNILDEAYLKSTGMVIEKDHLPESVFKVEVKEVEEKEESQEINYNEGMTLSELERYHICQTLKILSGNKTKTAKSLGITVKTLYNKLHSYGMIGTGEETTVI